MCSHYRSTYGRHEIARLYNAMVPYLANAPIDVFPDRVAPVVRLGGTGERELTEMRWGFPPPPQGSAPVVNVRNVSSPFWRAWLKPEYRCLVPFSAFAEWSDTTPKHEHWFALGDGEPLAAFAGLWRPWRGTRGTKREPVEGDHLLFSFLISQPNDIVRPIHAKAMPVILTTEAEWETWLTAPTEITLKLQRPLPEGLIQLAA